MRKWTYLVAALLISGTAATVTSCIDNEEPAGITELRGAKAELLKAKAQVQIAEASIKAAQANLMQARADLKAEEVAQAKLQTELMAAQTEDAKKAIEEAAAIRAEQAKASLIAAQQAAAEADYAYQKALLEISLQLSTMKNDVYAEALKALLVDKDYTYEYYGYTYVRKTTTVAVGDKRITIVYYEAQRNAQPTQVTVRGFISLSRELANVENEISVLLQNKADFEFTYKEEDFKTKYTALKAYWEGVKEGETEALATYKKIQGIDIAEWEASYKALGAEIEAAQVAKDAIEKKLAEDIVPLGKQRAELENKFGEVSELKIEVPAGIEEDVVSQLKNLVDNMDNQLSSQLREAINQMINNQISQNAEGDYVIANNTLTINLSATDKNALLTTDGFLEYFKMMSQSTAEDKAQANRYMLKLETNLNDAMQPYTTALAAWKKATSDFIAAADKYKYDYKGINSSRQYSAYATVKAAVDTYFDKAEPTAAETSAIKTFIANYLIQRAEIDGFKYVYKTDPTTQEEITMQAALKDATESEAALAMFKTDYEYSGNDDFYNRAIGSLYLDSANGLYGTVSKTSKVLWGEIPYSYNANNQMWSYNVNNYILEPITYEQWQDALRENRWYLDVYRYKDVFKRYDFGQDVYNNIYYVYNYYLLGDALANDYFAATFQRDEQQEWMTEKDLYLTFSTGLQATYDANKAVIDDYNAALYALTLQKTDLENAAGIETAKYQVIITEKGQLQDIMKKYTVTEAGAINESEFEAALKVIKNKIIDIEGGVKDPVENATPVYTKGSLATIAEEIVVCDDNLKAIEAGTFSTVKKNTLAAYDVQIALKNQEKEILQALYDAAKAKKDELLKGLTGTPAQ